MRHSCFMMLPRLAMAAAVLALSGCESILSLDGNPRLCRREPPKESLTHEVVIVRVVESPGPNERLLLDRLKYSAARDQRYINRVIYATTEQVRRAGRGVAGVERGDTLLVSTTYAGKVRGGGYEAYVDNWAANEGRCWDGGWVSIHSLTLMERPVAPVPPPR